MDGAFDFWLALLVTLDPSAVAVAGVTAPPFPFLLIVPIKGSTITVNVFLRLFFPLSAEAWSFSECATDEALLCPSEGTRTGLSFAPAVGDCNKLPLPFKAGTGGGGGCDAPPLPKILPNPSLSRLDFPFLCPFFVEEREVWLLVSLDFCLKGSVGKDGESGGDEILIFGVSGLAEDVFTGVIPLPD